MDALKQNDPTAEVSAGKQGITDQAIVYATAVACFLPFYLTIVILVALFLYIIISKKRKLIFSYKGSYYILPFIPVAIIPPLCYGNYLGVVTGVSLAAMLLYFQYLRAVMTRSLFNRVLDIFCIGAVIANSYGMLEYIYLTLSFGHRTNGFLAALFSFNGYSGMNNAEMRSSSFFFNPNYYGTICAVVLLICAYKIINGYYRNVFYYVASLSAIVGFFICGSMFALVEAFVAILAYLILSKHPHLLLIYLSVVIVVLIAIYVEPQIIRRLGKALETLSQRVRIWHLSLIEFTKAPVFGKGGLTYKFVCNDFIGKVGFKVYESWHAHNIVLDSLINYGLVGTLILGCFAGSVIYRPIKGRFYKKDLTVMALFIALACGMALHSIIDITCIWVQSGMIYLMLFSCVGVVEREDESEIPPRIVYDHTNLLSNTPQGF